ncbi:MAG: methyl-accepting chemotaxis protein [Synergistaceae bacterium]|nr:methyl-accepting chemotaxis protein [Synergistaceae bacterium]
MWRNLKISFKLLLGFGVLLLVFILAVFISWTRMVSVQTDSAYLSGEVVPIMMETTALERASYELFLAVRKIQYEFDDSSLEAIKTTIDETQKVLDSIDGLAAKFPELQVPKAVRENFLPAYTAYIDSVNKTIAYSTEKNKAWDMLVKAGSGMSTVEGKVMDSIFTGTEKVVQSAEPDVLSKRLELIRKGYEMANTIETLRRSIQKAMADEDISAIEGTSELVSVIDKDASYLESIAATPEDQAMVKDMWNSITLYKDGLKAFVAALKNYQAQNALRTPLMDKLNKAGTDVTSFAQKRVKSVADESVSQLGSAIFLLFASMLAAVILGVLIAIFISRSIAKPLATIVTLAGRAGEGDLTIGYKDFNYEGKDELGVLSLSMSNMVEAQGKAMQQVVSVAGRVMDGASNLSSISQETNASMEEVKASVDQVATLSESNSAALQECNAGVEEMSAGADTVARSATESAAFISQTTEASNKAIQTVDDVISGMRNVDKNSKVSEEKIRNLVSSVENVSSFVSVITGIADQTNLLALNAAIEAARAGEVGRGFAVVAEEVRKLAEESARAAQSVGSIITELQKGANESIDATTEAGRLLGETLTQAEQAQKELDQALKEINKANDSIQNIAAVAEEQAASCKEVATAIDSATKSTMEMVETLTNIRHATDETVQAAQGVAGQSEEMSGNAEDLTSILGQFRIPPDETSVGKKAAKAPVKTSTPALKASR